MTPTDDTPKPKKKPRRWLIPAFLVSLALNLLIAGVVGGWMLSPRGWHRPGPTDLGDAQGLVGSAFVRALPDAQRRQLLKDIFHDRGQLRQNRDSLRQQFETLLTAIRADPFDPAAIEALLEDQRQTAGHRQKIGESLILKRLSEMTPQERSAYADRLEATLRRLKPRGN